MAEHVYDDAVVDIVGPESLASAPVVIKVSMARSCLLVADIDTSIGPVSQGGHYTPIRFYSTIYTSFHCGTSDQSPCFRTLL